MPPNSMAQWFDVADFYKRKRLVLEIILNGKPIELSSVHLHDLLAEQTSAFESFAVAINQRFVSKKQYPNVTLRAGDQVELVSPMQGG